MEQKTDNEIIEKVFELTTAKKIIWEYLDENKSLSEKLKFSSIDEAMPGETMWNDFNVKLETMFSGTSSYVSSESFYAEVGENYIVLLRKIFTGENHTYVAGDLMFLMVPRTYKGIKIIEDSDVIQRLHSYLKSTFPDANDIIEDLFDM